MSNHRTSVRRRRLAGQQADAGAVLVVPAGTGTTTPPIASVEVERHRQVVDHDAYVSVSDMSCTIGPPGVVDVDRLAAPGRRADAPMYWILLPQPQKYDDDVQLARLRDRASGAR